VKKYKGLFTKKPELCWETKQEEYCAIMFGGIFGAFLVVLANLFIFERFFPTPSVENAVLSTILYIALLLFWVQNFEYGPEDFEEYYK
jgi:hypothetical protein